jgi:LPXTG-motif cell wall-anchored protein
MTLSNRTIGLGLLGLALAVGAFFYFRGKKKNTGIATSGNTDQDNNTDAMSTVRNTDAYKTTMKALNTTFPETKADYDKLPDTIVITESDQYTPNMQGKTTIATFIYKNANYIWIPMIFFQWAKLPIQGAKGLVGGAYPKELGVDQAMNDKYATTGYKLIETKKADNKCFADQEIAKLLGRAASSAICNKNAVQGGYAYAIFKRN